MDHSTIQIATAGNAAANAVLAIALAYLWRLRPDEQAPAFWSAALLLRAVRQIVILGMPDGLHQDTILTGLSGTLPVVLMYVGTLRFLGCPVPAWRLWALGGAIGALTIGTVTGILPFGFGIWATIVAAAATYLLTALAFLRGARDEPEMMYRVLGGLFLLWSLQLLLYPIYGLAAEGRAPYAVAASGMVLATAVALIMATQRRLNLRTLRTQHELERSNRRFQDFVETATAWVWEMDTGRRLTFVSQRVYDSLGIPPAAFIGRRFRDTPGIADVSMTLDEAERVFNANQPFHDQQVWITTTEGRRVRVSQSGKPVFDAAGRHTGFRGITIDITQTTHLEREIRDREALFRAVIDNMPIGFHLADPQGRILQRNQMLRLWSDRENPQVIGRTPSQVEGAPPDHHAEIEAELRQVVDTRQPLVRERLLSAVDGKLRPVLVHRFPIFGNDSVLSHVVTLVTDLSDIKQMEALARQSDTRLQRVVSALDLADKGVVVEDAHQRPIYANRTAGELMGLETGAIAMLERAGVGAEFGAQGSWTGEIIHRTRSGADAILQVSVARLPDGGTVTLLDDATERLERERRQVALERQVLEAQKMDAVGQLAGGIAHDFNNLLGAILGFTRFILEDTDAQSRVHSYAGRILSASHRARDLIQQILSFSRRENAPRENAALSALVEESAHLLRATLPSTLSIEIRDNFPSAQALVNATQITQILVNLCLNAADALGGRTGTIVLSLDRASPTEARLRWLFAADPGSLPKLVAAEGPEEPSRCYVGALLPGREYLVLGVSDRGSGIAPDVLARIFDPFFTTKARGQGTGLGLPVVQRLVLAHDGALVVSTRPGQGTLFEILLPLSDGAAKPLAEPADPERATEFPVARSKGRILVVDDDLHFGDMVSTALDRAGYEVGVCGRPGEALEAAGDQSALWDVLVTDLTMPEMSGLELIARMKALHPGLRCILCTGYASDRVNAASAAAAGADAFFHKPVEVAELLAAITQLTQPDPALQAAPSRSGVR
jgi:two-component system, cell cycle sensor histidine kinase and response regulator CckA